jgi:hypothetical protein
MDKGTHETAIEAALANDWDKAHEIVQVMNDPLACWIHAILHKIEGDASNSRYWYGRSGTAANEKGVSLSMSHIATRTRSLILSS